MSWSRRDAAVSFSRPRAQFRRTHSKLRRKVGSTDDHIAVFKWIPAYTEDEQRQVGRRCTIHHLKARNRHPSVTPTPVKARLRSKYPKNAKTQLKTIKTARGKPVLAKTSKASPTQWPTTKFNKTQQMQPRNTTGENATKGYRQLTQKHRTRNDVPTRAKE